MWRQNWWQCMWRRLEFASVFTGFIKAVWASHFSPVHEPLGGCWGSEISLTVSKEQVWDHVMKLNSHGSVRPDEMHRRVLAKAVPSLQHLSIISEQPWQSKSTVAGKREASLPLLKNIKGDPGSGSQTGEPYLWAWEDRGVDSHLLRSLLRYIQDKEMIQDSQKGFTKSKFWLTNLWHSRLQWLRDCTSQQREDQLT